MIRELRRYLCKLFGDEPPEISAVRAHLKRHRLPDISIPAQTGRLLTILVRLSQAKRALEIGTLGGVSASYIARALPEDGQLLTIERGAHNAAVAKESFSLAKVDHLVEILMDDALKVLPQLPPGNPFDLLFLDGEKADYPAYLNRALPLLRQGSLIVADNVLKKGKPWLTSLSDPSSIGLRQFNDFLAHDPRFQALILPTVSGNSSESLDGLAIALVL